MTIKILIRNYRTEDAQALASIYYSTFHRINIQHYTKEQVDEWAPASSLETEGWAKKFARTKPIVAIIENERVCQKICVNKLRGELDFIFLLQEK